MPVAAVGVASRAQPLAGAMLTVATRLGLGAGSVGCGGSQATTFDANGNVASRIDWNGNKTCSLYDLARNLETRRIEGLNSAASCASLLAASPPTLAAPNRMTQTQWSTDWRLPLAMSEPLRKTTYTYGSPTASNPGDRGNVLTTTIAFKGNSTVRVIGAEPHSGAAFWYSNRRDSGGARVMSKPSIKRAPVAVKARGNVPQSQAKRLDFPQPLSPIIVTISPGLTLRVSEEMRSRDSRLSVTALSWSPDEFIA